MQATRPRRSMPVALAILAGCAPLPEFTEERVLDTGADPATCGFVVPAAHAFAPMGVTRLVPPAERFEIHSLQVGLVGGTGLEDGFGETWDCDTTTPVRLYAWLEDAESPLAYPLTEGVPTFPEAASVTATGTVGAGEDLIYESVTATLAEPVVVEGVGALFVGFDVVDDNLALACVLACQGDEASWYLQGDRGWAPAEDTHTLDLGATVRY